MKLISFLVFLLALVGNSKASALASTLRVLHSVEQTSQEVHQVKEEVISAHTKSYVSFYLKAESKISNLRGRFFHSNFSIDKLTFYYNSRLRS